MKSREIETRDIERDSEIVLVAGKKRKKGRGIPPHSGPVQRKHPLATDGYFGEIIYRR